MFIILWWLRYDDYTNKAWSWSEILTPHGKKSSKNAFVKVNRRDYAIAIEQHLERIMCTVTRHSSQVTNTCWFPIEYNLGSLFGNAVVEGQAQMAFHVCTCVLLWRVTESMVLLRPMSCQNGGTPRLGASNIQKKQQSGAPTFKL